MNLTSNWIYIGPFHDKLVLNDSGTKTETLWTKCLYIPKHTQELTINTCFWAATKMKKRGTQSATELTFTFVFILKSRDYDLYFNDLFIVLLKSSLGCTFSKLKYYLFTMRITLKQQNRCRKTNHRAVRLVSSPDDVVSAGYSGFFTK